MTSKPPGAAITGLLLLALAFALAVRLVGVFHGLPAVVGADEGFEIHRALKLGMGEIDVERVGKGGFFYLLFVEYGVYFVWLLLTGRIGGPDDFALRFAADPSPFWLIGRVTNALLGTLAVVATWSLGRRAYGRRAALFGAAVVSVSLLCVRHAAVIGVDAPMTLLLIVGVGLALAWAEPGKRPRPVLLGTVFGAAVMTKVPAIVLALPIAIANWLRHRGRGLRRALAGRRVLVVYAVAAGVFMAGNPGFTLRMGDFARRVWGTLAGTPAPAAGFVSGTSAESLPLYYWNVLRSDLGLGLVGLALAGVAWALVRRRPADLLILPLVAGLFYLIAGARTSQHFYPRYALPLVPFLGLLAGRALVEAADRLPLPARARGPAIALAGALLLLPGAAGSVEWAARQTREDTRLRARDWMEANAPSGSGVFLVGHPIVESAPTLSIPLRNTDANVERLIGELAETEPSKAKFLELRRRVATGVPFDLHTVRHFEENASLADYERAGVRYFVILGRRFDPERLESDRKHADAVLASRAALYEELRADPRVERVLALDPERDRLSGPDLEIFRLVPVARDAEAEEPGPVERVGEGAGA